MLKKMGEDAGQVSADGGAFVTVTESHDTAPHDAGGQEGTGSDTGPAQTPAPIAVHDATTDAAHTAPADAPGTASFDHNV